MFGKGLLNPRMSITTNGSVYNTFPSSVLVPLARVTREFTQLLTSIPMGLFEVLAK